MANAANQKKTAVLLQNFAKIHGVQGFFTQGLAPELARSTWMRFIKFGKPILRRATSPSAHSRTIYLTLSLSHALRPTPFWFSTSLSPSISHPGLFPIVHKAISGTSEAQGTALTRVVAAAITR